MKTLILPIKKTNTETIDISEVSEHNLIVVYNDTELIGFCIYYIESEHWYLQTQACEDGLRYQSNSLYELISDLQEDYQNLKILVKSYEKYT